MKKRLPLAKIWYIGLIVAMLAYIPGQALAQVFDETDGFTNEAAWTVDSDNTGAGVDVDIVANQGSDNDGTIRYNATANQWEISNDGGAFAAISTGGGGGTLDTAYDFGGAGAGRTVTVDGGAVELSGTGSVLSLGNNTAADITVTFNEDTTDGTLTWDNANDEFDFSNNVNVTGSATTSTTMTVGTTLAVNGTSATLDADNAVAGADVDLVANQGSDLDGTLRYNATANQWEISNDGGGFNAITSSATDADTQNTLDGAYDEGGAGAGRTITVDGGAVVLSGTGFVLELGNGTAADSVITFNDGVNRNMGWDDSESAISTFVTDFIAGGNLEVNGTLATIDANNVAGGADVDIIANQGLDSDGTIRYNSTANRWEISNDGGAFAAIPSGGGGTTGSDYVYAYDTTTQTVATANTFQDITFDTNGLINGWSHTAGTANFTAATTGLYMATVTANTEKASGGGSPVSEIRALFNGTEIAGSEVGSANSTSGVAIELSRTFIFNATASQIFKLELTGSTTSVQLTPEGANASTLPSISLAILRMN